MAVSMKLMSMIIATFGGLSFIFGVVAENKKPAAGIPITVGGVVKCHYPNDPTVVLGYLSGAFLIISSVAGYLSLSYPYQGKSIPLAKMFKSRAFVAFFNVALAATGLGLTFLLWPTIQEQLHLVRNVHHNLQTDCPTAKTGLLGGGAFLSLDASLFWLVALMLADNVREDYFDEIDSKKAALGGVVGTEYEADATLKSNV